MQIRLQRYLNMPLVQRCKEIAMLIDESSTTELQHVFSILIDSLFGITDNIGWGLHSITFKKNAQEYETLCNFLNPQGPVFSLCYKLLPDCYLKYNFPVSFLPVCKKLICILVKLKKLIKFNFIYFFILGKNTSNVRGRSNTTILSRQNQR